MNSISMRTVNIKLGRYWCLHFKAVCVVMCTLPLPCFSQYQFRYYNKFSSCGDRMQKICRNMMFERDTFFVVLLLKNTKDTLTVLQRLEVYTYMVN